MVENLLTILFFQQNHFYLNIFYIYKKGLKNYFKEFKMTFFFKIKSFKMYSKLTLNILALILK